MKLHTHLCHSIALSISCALTGTLIPFASAHASDAYQPVPYVKFKSAEWTKDATLYQINTRQFTPEGTFKAAEAQLPRLKKLGVDIIWLMPIHPIGKVNRKGSLGSPYAVADYRQVNPEFGTMDDFKHFVKTAHQLGLRVILDWVGNHTAWDNVLRTSHPEWYDLDASGKPHPTPWYDWDDIIDLDYSKPGLRRYMADSMKFWVKDIGIDGYRVDAAGLTPLDFWENVSQQLRAIKPVFMLAEWESRDLHAKAFDATYAWTWWDAVHNITAGKADATSLYTYYAWNEKFYPKQAYRMIYTSNHDKNSWDGTEFEMFGAGVNNAIVFSFVSQGIPLIYNGQEAGNQKRLAFFERDPIEWKESPYNDLYQKLIALKKQNSALWNGEYGATMVQVINNAPKAIFSFVRENPKNKVFAVFNFSAQTQQVSFSKTLHFGKYRDFETGKEFTVDANTHFDMAPWTYRVLVK